MGVIVSHCTALNSRGGASDGRSVGMCSNIKILPQKRMTSPFCDNNSRNVVLRKLNQIKPPFIRSIFLFLFHYAITETLSKEQTTRSCIQ